jgi:glycosyltransferase involved in cell wall biosynthesis
MQDEPLLSCTVVVPCRDEVGNVGSLVERVPSMGSHTELIFVDGSSTDGTPERIHELIEENPDRDIKLLHQPGPGGKAAAVFQGFDAANGDILIILDADMTVPPDDLPKFYSLLASGRADFANGTRFQMRMESGAMPGLNNLGNRVFSRLFSWLLGAKITDTLCGTKALLKRDWICIDAARPLFGGHDPWGDFDLLLGAAYCGLRIAEVPIRYRARVAGESKMQPLRHGPTLAATYFAGFRRLKRQRSSAGKP